GKFTNGTPVETVAFVHHEVRGFTVLPVLACREIVLSDQGALGDIRLGGKLALTREAEASLKSIANQRFGERDAILKMPDTLFTSAKAQEAHLTHDTCATLPELLRRKQLSPHLAREVLMGGRDVVAFCIEFTGTV